VKEVVEAWLNKAGTDLKHAKASYKIEDYDWAELASQQAAEKALKALCILKGHGLIKVHDLTMLARKVNAPKDVLENCGLLNPFYTASRYPDISESIDEKQNRKAASDSIKAAQVVLKWCKSKIKI